MISPKLVVADSFEETLSSLRQNLPHAIILAGPSGIGLGRLAEELADRQAIIISPGEATKTTLGTISIDRVRELYIETRGRSKQRQTFLIKNAELMSEPAQNAILKLLEEPGSSIRFILTSHRPERLLPTIRSRAQIIRVPQISNQQSRELLDRFKLDDIATTQLMFVASGRPADLVRLAQNPRAREELAETMRDAKVVIGNDRYAAFHTSLKYSHDLAQAQRLLTAVRRLIEHAIGQSSDQRHVERLSQLIDTQDRMHRSANLRLQLAQFVLQYH